MTSNWLVYFVKPCWDSFWLTYIIPRCLLIQIWFVAQHEPPQTVIKEVLHFVWNNIRAVKVTKANENVYAITLGEEVVARQLLDDNPWFVKGFSFSVKHWPLYCSLDDIVTDRAIYWVQAHGIPRNICSTKNARMLGARVRSVLKVEDIEKLTWIPQNSFLEDLLCLVLPWGRGE
ncbi:unnamed protein product [Prunus armeniaca]|uniref:Uncharacterized protein n=1 Tax=Prunus armeniaca TaxID=36596 RepID=A0A6J5WMW1_PRUAR|nr:unnamed protein product [Prunus armeniaca]